ncbi:MAG: acyl-ACP--UDP-N-acetylglucosamine O-acyltransferase [Holosporales bacterium]|jgi:UDP-N-acetylglucosamine acyltransferase|nr:acyl-ACP--UDP-N-acetylglucosamine O-acyltransferase [Holosporales bacterium]
MSNVSGTAVIHETAVVEDGAVIGKNCCIGPYCCIGPRVVIGDNVLLKSHVVIAEDTVIGDSTTIYPFASLGQKPQDLKYKNERSRLEIGKNTVIREYVTANIGTEGGGMLTKIGNNCLIMAYCHIAHDCLLGDNVILVNGVNLSGHVVVGDDVIIGGMSAVKQFIRIGKNAIIGGFTGVDRDVIPYGVARSDRVTTVRGINIIGLKRRGFSAKEIEKMLSAYRDIFEKTDSDVQFTQNLVEVRLKYSGNSQVEEIIDFIDVSSKNPICTTIPTDY